MSSPVMGISPSLALSEVGTLLLATVADIVWIWHIERLCCNLVGTV